MRRQNSTLTPMDSQIAREVMREAVRAVYDRYQTFPGREAFRLDPWCDELTGEIGERRVVFAYRAEVVTLQPPPARRQHPASIYLVGNELLSTRELRQHAFAAYATAMAYYGPDAALAEAVAETLRRQPNWDRTVAIRHTRKFVIPAYDRAFPGHSDSHPK